MGTNRISEHAARCREVIAAGGKDGALDTPEKLAAFDASQSLELWESAKYRDMNAHAFARGLLTLDEANLIYNALGREGFPSGNGGWSKGTDTAMKVTITSLMGQLMGVKA
jgi:hypothetical protein